MCADCTCCWVMYHKLVLEYDILAGVSEDALQEVAQTGGWKGTQVIKDHYCKTAISKFKTATKHLGQEDSPEQWAQVKEDILKAGSPPESMPKLPGRWKEPMLIRLLAYKTEKWSQSQKEINMVAARVMEEGRRLSNTEKGEEQSVIFLLGARNSEYGKELKELAKAAERNKIFSACIAEVHISLKNQLRPQIRPKRRILNEDVHKHLPRWAIGSVSPSFQIANNTCYRIGQDMKIVLWTT